MYHAMTNHIKQEERRKEKSQQKQLHQNQTTLATFSSIQSQPWPIYGNHMTLTIYMVLNVRFRVWRQMIQLERSYKTQSMTQ
jgi:hypothetical protein